MRLLADLHTHSSYSRFGHGKNTIEEMAIAANEMGLMEIGITDHGYSHFFRTTKENIKKARKIIDEINSWSKTKVLLGVEADIIREDGTIDIDNETLSMLDILIVGYHKMTFTDFAGFLGGTKNTEESKRKCTNAFVNAINRYPVTIVAHLDSILTTDLYEIGRACSERGTLVEINNRHTHWNDKQMEALLASDCCFVVSSDAHSRDAVGEVNNSFDLIKKYNIPSERITNIEFTEDEKTEDDRQYSAYMSIYEKISNERKEKQQVIDERQKTEITGKLSKEMEDALRQIANEKGIEYSTGRPGVLDSVSENTGMSDEDEKLLRQAEEYVRLHSLESINEENDKIDVSMTDTENFEFDENRPLSGHDNSFESRFQLSSVFEENEKPKQYSSGNFVKPPEFNVEPEQKQQEDSSKVEPENFMQSITQTRLASNAVEPEKTEPEEPVNTVRKVTNPNERGTFIGTNGIVGDDNK